MWIQALTSLYGCVALLALATGGLLLMFSPALGRLLQNAAVSVGMFVVGSLLLQACCAKGRS